MKFRNLRIKTKQIIGFSSVLLIFAGVNIFSILGINAIKWAIDDFEQNWLPRTIAITEINTNSSNLRREQLQYAFASDESVKKEETAKNKLVCFLENVEEFVDFDGVKMGSFEKGQIANVPNEIAKNLVDQPDEVKVNEIDGERTVVYE